jgi:hypothetical protein
VLPQRRRGCSEHGNSCCRTSWWKRHLKRWQLHLQVLLHLLLLL